MPYTTPHFPPSVSASVRPPSLLTAPSSENSESSESSEHSASARQPALQQTIRAVLGPSTASQSDSVGAAIEQQHTKDSSRRAPERRRLTLTSRFPLLRKGSREHTRTAVPSIHIRGSSISHNLPSPSGPPLLAPREPRASISSFRGRSERASSEQSPRYPSSTRSARSANHELTPDNASTHSTTPLASAGATGSTTPETDHFDAKLDPNGQALSAAKTPRPQDRKMHQTSSRLLRMTDDERPFTRDFKDLFATLMVSLPLTPHRVRFRMIDFTFTSDEAVTNLGSLKFSQSNRMPDPKDSSRVVTTTTTTTFSMAKEMARSVCQKFLEAKFIESVEGKLDFQNKNNIWQLTPKGIHILERFCSRNGIQSAHVKAVIDSSRNPRQLVILERDRDTDKLHNDEQTVEIIFRRFVGANVNETTASDSDSIHEFSRCDVGVKMMKHKPTASRPWEYVFNGKATVEWLMDCCTMVDRREGVELGQMFLELGLIAHVDPRADKSVFVPIKQAHYYVSQHGEQVAGWSAPDEVSPATDSNPKARDGAARDSNSNRTNVIIRNPSWRLLYREFLKETMCEENLSFYLEVQEFNNQYRAALNTSGDNKIETIRETLAAAYGLYNAFLAPGSPNELNIDHALRTQLATRMTRAVGDDTAMTQSLVEVAQLFEKAQNSIFKLMSSDSVPKFIKHPKYATQLRGLDAAAAASYGAQPPTGSRSS